MDKIKLLILLLLLIVWPKLTRCNYTIPTEVVNVIQPYDVCPEGFVVCKTEDNRYITFDGSEDWEKGDIAELTINDNGTEYRLDDDYVIKAIYKGWNY